MLIDRLYKNENSVCSMQLFLHWCGDDVLVSIQGGIVPHIGAVAVAVPCHSIADPNRCSVSTSVFCVIGHKEDTMAKKYACELCRLTRHVVTATVGIHIDHASADAIEVLLNQADELWAYVIADLRKINFLKTFKKETSL